MRAVVYLMTALLVVIAVTGACAPIEPTAAPTKPGGAASPGAPTVTGAISGAPTPAATKAPAASPTPVAKVKRGGTAVVAKDNGPSTFDPLFTSVSGPTIEPPVFQALIRWDLKDHKTGKHDFGPELAESWQIIDPKTIALKLQRGVKFHDSSEWNAEVAKWNLDRVLTHPKSMGKALVGAISSVDIVDPFTIKLNLKQPSATILNALTRATGGGGSSATLVVSKAAYEKMGEDAFGNKPVGTGPMQIVEWKRDDRLEMKKFDSYWKKGIDGQPLPYVDAMVSRYIADKAVTLVEMKAGTIHVTSSIDAKDIASVKENPELVFVPQPWASDFYSFVINQQKEPYKSNKKLRQAIQYALDRESMAKTLGFGEARAAYFPVWNPSFPGYDESLFKYEFNLDKANALMKEAGLDGGINLVISTTANPAYQRVAEITQAMWSRAQIKSSVEALEQVAVYNKVKAGNYDVELERMSPSPDPDFYTRWLTCDGRANFANYCNPELDKCMLEGGAKYDPKERHEIYKKCINIINEDAFQASLFMMPLNIVHRKELKGVLVQGWMMDLSEVWIDK